MTIVGSALGRLVLNDLLLDFVRVDTRIRPSIREIFSTERGIAAQQVCLTRAKTTRLHKNPYRNARARNPGFTTKHMRCAIDTRKRIRQVAYDPLEHLGFLGTRELGEDLPNVLKRTHRPTLFRVRSSLLQVSLYHVIR